MDIVTIRHMFTCSLFALTYLWDGKMSEMWTGMTSIDPDEKLSTILKAATSPAVTKKTVNLSGDLLANKPMRLR